MKQLGNIYREISSRRKGIGEKLQSCRVMGLWEEVVGEKVAKKSEPAGIYGGTLRVIVESSAWANELLFLKKDIINKINSHLETRRPFIRDIRFKIGKKKLVVESNKIEEKTN